MELNPTKKSNELLNFAPATTNEDKKKHSRPRLNTLKNQMNKFKTKVMEQVTTPILKLSNSSVHLDFDHVTTTSSTDTTTSTIQKIKITPPEPPIPSFLTMLPREVQIEILSRLSLLDLCQCQLVCASWYGLLQDSNLWAVLCQQKQWTKVPPKLLENFNIIDWKMIYKFHYQTEKNWLSGRYRVQSFIHKEIIEVASNENLPDDNEIQIEINEPQKESKKEVIDMQPHEEAIYALYSNEEFIYSASKDGHLKKWNLEPELLVDWIMPNHSVFNYKQDPPVFEPKPAAIHCFLLTESKIILGLLDGSLLFCNAVTDEILCHLKNEHTDGVSCLINLSSFLSSTQKLNEIFISAGFDGQCRVYGLQEEPSILGKHGKRRQKNSYYSASGRFRIGLLHVFRYHKGSIYALASTEEWVYSAGSDLKIHYWNLEGQHDFWEAHESTITSLAVLSTHHLVSGSFDKTIKIWDTQSKDCLKIITCHCHWIKQLDTMSSLSLQPTHYRLISSGFDGTIRVWHINQQNLELKQILEIPFKEYSKEKSDKGICMKFYSDSYRIVAGDAFGRLFSFSFDPPIDL